MFVGLIVAFVYSDVLSGALGAPSIVWVAAESASGVPSARRCTRDNLRDRVAQIITVDVDFGEGGLVPTAAQGAGSGEVLMLAYVSPEALDRTIETGQAHYYLRSRDELWEKGASSDHTQEVREVRVDCDADALLYLVDQSIGACHTGHRSCFYRAVEGEHISERVFDPDTVYDDK